VENLTLLFTDLGNSTALYERIGDAPAYGRVGAHFQFLVKHVKEHGGALVKTMGDAVMAVFFSPEEAVLSALSMLRDFPEFVRTHGDWDEVYLKVGVHHGPALAVNENEKLDYFGRTVNLAARLVSAASGPEIILTKEILEREGVVEALDAQSTCRTSFSRPLRGVAQEMELVRVRLS
jgi:class 3 adenylate cyclase